MKESKLIKFFKTKEFLVVLCSLLCTLAVWGGICIVKNIQNERLRQQSIVNSVYEDSDDEEYSDSTRKKTPVLKVKTKTASLLVKETTTISVTVEGTEDKPTFTSSDDKIATVNEEGVVQAISAGKAEITIELGSLSGVCNVIVEDSARVTALINALPKADNLTGLSGVAITEARAAYDALSDRAKESVKNYKTLTNLEKAYAKGYRMLYSMTDIASFTKNSNYPGYKNVLLTSGKDETYGKVLTAIYANEVLGDNHVIVSYKKAENIEWLLEGYGIVTFYVYNSRPDDAKLICNFGGKMITDYITLSPKAWTKVEVPAEDFLSGSYFGIYDIGYRKEAQEFKFSPIWAERGPSPEELAQVVIDLINALPAKDKLNALSGTAIEEARNAYNALKEEAQVLVKNYATLVEIESTYHVEYKMIYGMSDISVFKNNDNYPGFQYFKLTPGTDATYSKVLNATYANESMGDYHVVIKYTKSEDIAEQLKGYKKVCFYVYNGRSDARQLMCDFGGSLKVSYATLDAGAWTKVEVPAADFISGTYFGIYEVGYQTGTQEFKFSPIWAERGPSPEALAQSVIDMIATLPEAEQLNALSGTAIVEARTAYDALDEDAKAKVSNYATLTALESAYEENYKMIYGMSNISAFSINDNYPGFQYFELTPGTDATYGKVLNVTYTSDSAGDGHVVIKYAKPSDLAAQLSGYKKVCFYVYNGRSDTRELMCDFGGSLKVSYATLDAGTWTKVEVPVADFISSSYFGIYSVGYKTGTQEFKFSAIWAEKGPSPEALAQSVIDMIAALPEAEQLNALSGSAIVEARTAYDALDEDAKAQVSNYATLTALESAYAENYKMLYGMSNISAFAVNNNYPGFQYYKLTAGTDGTYGKVLNVTYATESAGDGHIVITYTKPEDLAAQVSEYDKVCFYVYNGRSDSRELMCDFGGGLKVSYATLNSGVWTKVEVPVADFISGSFFGIYSVGYKTGTQDFKFSAIWAEKGPSLEELAQSVIDMIAALPTTNELKGHHGTAITEARIAYDALAEEAKAKVSNYATLTALESAYNAKYKMIYSMVSDISKFSKHSSYNYQDVTLDTNPGDSEYGKVLTANCTNKYGEYHVVLQYDNPSNLAEQLSGYDKVCFYIWNGRPSGASAKKIMHDFGGEATTPDSRWSLPSQTWTKIELTVDEFVNSSYFGLYEVSNSGSYSFKFTSIWAEKGNSEEVQHVIEMIDALPKTNALEGYHKDVITKAKTTYNALSDVEKAQVSNYETLTSLESAYNAKYKMIYDMSIDVSKFSEHSSHQYQQVTLAATPEDSEYGKTLTVNCTNDGSEYHVVLQYDNPSDLAEQLSGYDKVCFYIWNGRPSGASAKKIMHDFGGVSKNPDSRWSLASQTWTKIELTVDEFVKSTYFGLFEVSNSGSYSFKITSIWAECEVEQENYKMIYSMTDIASFTKNSDYAGYQYFALNSETDATYGSVLNATYASESTGDYHLVINYDKPSDLATQLSGYSKVCFYVYNGRTDDRKLLCNFGGSLIREYTTLNAGTWTKVEVPVADFISGSYFGIYSVGYKTGTQEFKFSPMWAE